MLILRVLLGFLSFYVVYQNYFDVQFTVKGLNYFNLMFFGVLAIVIAKGIRSEEPAPLKGAFTFLFIMLGWGYVIGLMDDGSTWLEDLVELKTSVFYLLLYHLYYRAVQDSKTLKFVLAAVLITAFLAQLQAVRQGLDYGIGAYNETRRAAGPFGKSFLRANSAAAFYVIFVPVAAAFMLELKRGWKIKAALLFSVGIGIFGLFVTYSRQGYLILGVILLYLTFRKNLGLALLLCLVLMSYRVWAPDAMIQRIEMTQQQEDPGRPTPTPKPGAAADDGEGQKYDESTESRFLIWAGAMEMISEHPLGVGLNHFKRNIGIYVPRYRGFDAHNNYIRMAAEASIFGALAMLVIIAKLFVLGWRIERVDKSDSSRAMGLALQVAALGVLLSNVYGSRFFDGDVTGNVWVLAALGARYFALRRKQAQPAQAEQPAVGAVHAMPVRA